SRNGCKYANADDASEHVDNAIDATKRYVNTTVDRTEN
ncbi:hypothetical protein Q184_02856, partial [Staphylococcus aureus M1182]